MLKIPLLSKSKTNSGLEIRLLGVSFFSRVLDNDTSNGESLDINVDQDEWPTCSSTYE